jgi:glutathione S-transferase
MSVKVYGVPGSPFMRAVLVGLEEKGASYDLVPISGPETKQPAHLARHPFGRVPAFEHDGFALYETQAILRYVDATFPGPSLRPADVKQLARMDQLIGICDWYLFPQVSVTIAFQRIVKPLLMGGTPDEEIIAKAIPNAERCYAVIAGFLQGAFLAGPELSIADIMIACQMSMLAATPECQAIIAKHPGLRDWLTRMEARPSFERTDLLKRKAA